MRRRFRYDADLEEVVEIRESSNYFEEKPQGPNVIRDDVGAGVNGLRHMPSGLMLDSKSRHRAETKARGLVEVGSDNMAAKPMPLPKDHYNQIVKTAHDQWVGDWNGTRAQVRKMGG